VHPDDILDANDKKLERERGFRELPVWSTAIPMGWKAEWTTFCKDRRTGLLVRIVGDMVFSLQNNERAEKNLGHSCHSRKTIEVRKITAGKRDQIVLYDKKSKRVVAQPVHIYSNSVKVGDVYSCLRATDWGRVNATVVIGDNRYNIEGWRQLRQNTAGGSNKGTYAIVRINTRIISGTLVYNTTDDLVGIVSARSSEDLLLSLPGYSTRPANVYSSEGFTSLSSVKKNCYNKLPAGKVFELLLFIE